MSAGGPERYDGEREEKVRLIKMIGSQDWELKGIVIIGYDNGGSDLGAHTHTHSLRIQNVQTRLELSENEAGEENLNEQGG